MVLTVLLGGIVAVLAYDYGSVKAAGNSIAPARVAVVNVDMILKNSKKHANWQNTMNTQESQIRAELEKLSRDADAIKADMATRERGSTGYMTLLSSYMEKTAAIEAKDKYYEQEMTMKIQRWTESLYQEILDIVNKTARVKGIDVVLAAQEISFPGPSIRDLLTTIRTNKVLYHASDVDITEEVLAQLDSNM